MFTMVRKLDEFRQLIQLCRYNFFIDAVAIAGDDVITDIVKTLSSSLTPLLLRDTQSWLSVSELWHISMQGLLHIESLLL